MQKTTLTIIALLFLTKIFSQKTEFNICLNSGIFYFAGLGTYTASEIMHDYPPTSIRTVVYPHKSRGGLCYGFSGDVKRVTKFNVLYGLNIGYENAKSINPVNQVEVHTGTLAQRYKASGKIITKGNFLNVHPYVGYRYRAKHFFLDITAGLEFSCGPINTQGTIIADAVAYSAMADRFVMTDERLRIQISANYRKAGIYIGYAHGRANYHSTNMISGHAYPRLVKFGVTYRL